MGIQGLLTTLKSIQTPCSLKKFSGLTLGVDAYGWLHRGTVACAIDLALGKPTTKFVDFAMHRVRMLIHFGITPYIVFDGDYLPSKAATEDSRAKRRSESKRLGIQLYNAGRISQAQNELQKAVDVTPEMARQLIDELRRHNIQYVVAPYEADAQLAYLERQGLVQGIISEDSDLLVFGAKRLLTKLDQYGECIEINRRDFAACKEIQLVGWTDAQFRQMAILSGCDYLSNINNMGLKTAYRLLRKYKKIEKVIQVIQFDSKFRVPAGYYEDFRKAELTFLHQRVYCPTAKKVIASATMSPSGFDSLDFIGKEIDDDVGRAVASGDLHPMTKKILVSSGPAITNSPSPWTATRRKGVSALSPQENKKPSKPIESFFKPRRLPLAELDPNSFTPSPSQRRVQEQHVNTWFTSPLVTTPNTNSQSVPRPSRTSANRSASQSSSAPPLKRARLCHDQAAESGIAASSCRTTSRFFKKIDVQESPLLVRENRRKPADIHIFSDDSIEEAMLSLPDIEDSKTQATPKLSVFRDENCARIAPSAKSRSVSQESISTAGSALSFAASTNLSTGTQDTSASMLLSREDSKSSECSIHLDDGEAARGLGGRDLDDLAETNPVGSRIIPATPEKVEKLPLRGSEDFLIPNSEDELERHGELESETPVKSKLDLRRFIYSNDQK